MIDRADKMINSRPKYFTPNEVSVHNTLKDLWVSFLGKVYDLTPLCDKYSGMTIYLSPCPCQPVVIFGPFHLVNFVHLEQSVYYLLLSEAIAITRKSRNSFSGEFRVPS